MTEEIDIPETAFESKPWWENAPTEERIEEILKFILRTKKPYLWPGQTYNKPPKSALIEYLAEFFLPKSSLLAPCPCCTPRHPKYRHGMIAYFPNERVIRIMGHDCFKSFDAEGHAIALKKFHAEVQRKKDILYLLDNLDKVPEYIAAAESATPVGFAVDKLRNDACIVFKEVLRIDLWNQIRTGELRISKTQHTEAEVPGFEDRKITIIETYGRIEGQDFLKARSPRWGLKLKNSSLALQQINFGKQYNERIASMSDAERRQATSLFSKAVKAIAEAYSAINNLRQFTSASTIATLNGWARMPECSVHVHIAFDGNNLYVGSTEDRHRRIEVPREYMLSLKPLPKLAYKVAAE